jgi:hypothetical protein
MKTLFLLLALCPLSLAASEKEWAGTGSFHSSGFGKNEEVPVVVKITVTKDGFDSLDCWQPNASMEVCSIQSFDIRNGDELWNEEGRVGSLSRDPLRLNVAYSTRGAEITLSFDESPEAGASFAYTFDYPTESYVKNTVQNLKRK